MDERSDNPMIPLLKASADIQAAVSIDIGEGASDFMESVPVSRQVTVEFADVTVWVPKVLMGNSNALVKSTPPARSLVASVGKRLDDAASSSKSDTRQVLYNISGTCRAGEMLALMGPWGSGKSTLLSVLGGRSSKSINVQGQVTYNGQGFMKQIKRRVGFVSQDSFLYPTLTVYETLYFAAMLRMPRSMTKEQKLARVEAVIDTLGLRKCRDTILGDFSRRGLSRGELKRVSVGHELLINPSVMMLDEPTLGLDSTTAMHLLTMLRQLAAGGRSIVMTIHQPSSRLYQQLDKLLLLSEGHAMYYGQAIAAPEWFRRLGYTMPCGVNTADFILDLATADVRKDKVDSEGTRAHLIECHEAYASTRRAEGVYDGYKRGHELNASGLGSQQWGLGPAGLKEEPEEDKDPQHRWTPSYWLQLKILFLQAMSPSGDAPDSTESVPVSRQFSVEFADVNVWVPKMRLGYLDMLIKSTALAGSFVASLGKGKGDAASSDKSDMRQVLYNISGTCRAGEMLALIGPSGSGTTTLLSVLAGQSSKGIDVQGQVTYNEQRLTRQINRRVAIVWQMGLLSPTLTVYETLYVAAMSRLPRSMTKEQKLARVEAVIDTLGLRKCRYTIIGGCVRRGVSGGERKRVLVGRQLLMNPSVMMLDEPTWGLDSTTAMHLITMLRQLAAGGRSIVMTIHQPSSGLYLQLDKLLLLSEGHAMYYGQANAAPEWFLRLGFTMLYGVNAADFILDLASVDVRTGKGEGEEAREFLIECQEAYASTRRAEGVYDGYKGGYKLNESVLGSELWGVAQARTNETYRTSTDGDGKSAKPWPPSDPNPASVLQRQEPKEKPEEDKDAQHRWSAPYWMQLQILFLRAVKARHRFELSTQDIALMVLYGVSPGFMWARSDTLLSASNAKGFLFLEIVLTGIVGLGCALTGFPFEFKMMLNERASGMYRLSAFCVARAISELTIMPSPFMIIFYFQGRLRLTPGAIFANVASVMLLSAVSNSFVLLIWATLMVPRPRKLIISIAMLGLMMVGGYYVNLIPAWLAWRKYLSFMFYGYNLLLKIEYAGRTIWDCHGTNPPHPETTKGCVPIPPDSLKQALRLPTDPDQWPWEALALLTWLIVFHTLVYIALRYKTRATKPCGTRPAPPNPALQDPCHQTLRYKTRATKPCATRPMQRNPALQDPCHQTLRYKTSATKP